MAGEQAAIGGLICGICAAQPQMIAIFGLSGIASSESLIAGIVTVLTPVGWFGLLAVGAAVTIGGTVCAFRSFSERKMNAYNKSIQNIREKFFSLYDGYEKKIISQYNAW